VGLCEVHCSDPFRRILSNWTLSVSYLPQSKTGGRTNALPDETSFLGRTDVDEEQGFTDVSSFLWDREVSSKAAHLYVEAPESVDIFSLTKLETT
jgi:hypothetical protein